MNRLLKGFLLVSVSFNVMFAVGYFCAPSTAEPPESPDAAAAALADKLGLDASQQATFASLRREANERAAELAQHAALLQEQLWSEAADPAADPKTIESTAKDLGAVRDAYREVQVAQFRRFMGVLTPQQRQAVMERRRTQRPGLRARLEREFDTDGNGVLDPAERENALRAFRERFRGAHPEGPRSAPLEPGGRRVPQESWPPRKGRRGRRNADEGHNER
jgi:hypothetical protein